MKPYDTWALYVQLAGMFFVAVQGAIVRKAKPIIILGILWGWAINIAAQMKIADEGPGACVGWIAFPLYAIIIGCLSGRVAARVLKWRERRQHARTEAAPASGDRQQRNAPVQDE